jgi:DnaJ-class molecular chaperone
MHARLPSLQERDAAEYGVTMLRAVQRGVALCVECGGDGMVTIDPIHDDGMIWTAMPCDRCEGTGVMRCETVAAD